MKLIFQIPIFILMLFASGYSFASSTSCAALSDGDIEAYLTKVCSASSNDGAIRVKINSTTGPFELRYFIKVDGIWKILGDPIIITQPTDDIKKNLSTGEYMVVVIDNRCAMAEMEVELDVNDPITISATPEPICQSGTGSISPVVSGGQPPYTFQWSNGATDQEITGRDVGMFTITVTDSQGCKGIKQFQINQKYLSITGGPNISYVCNDLDVADISVSVTNGTGPFSFIWNTGETGPVITGKKDGIYTVSATDINGCKGSKTYVLERYISIRPVGDNPGVNTVVLNTCKDENKGAIWLQHTSASGSTYNWTKNGETYSGGRFIQNLTYGLYCVTVTHNSCQTSECYELKEVEIIQTDPVFQIGCGNDFGSIGVKERLPYFDDETIQNKSTYKWSHDGNLTSDQATNLSPGIYTVSITNPTFSGTSSCKEMIYSYQIQIINPPSITGTVYNGKQGGNFNPPSGKIDITVNGGSSNYLFSWQQDNNPSVYSTTEDIENVSSAKYTVTVTDNMTGCIIIKTFIVENETCKIATFNMFFAENYERSTCVKKGVCDEICNKSFSVYYTPLNLPKYIKLPLKLICSGPFDYNEIKVINTQDELNNMKADYRTNNVRSNLIFENIRPSPIPYVINIIDDCKNEFRLEFIACQACGKPAVNTQNSNKNYVTFSGGLNLIIDNLCDKYKYGRQKIKINKSSNIVSTFNFKIVWPDGKESKIVGNGYQKIKIEGPTEYKLFEFDMRRPLSIFVERMDGCFWEYTAEFYGEKENILFPKTSEGKSYTCNVPCSSCEGGGTVVYSDNQDCDNWRTSSLSFFRFQPNNTALPTKLAVCNSGGTFEAWTTDGTVIKKDKIIVPINKCKGVSETNGGNSVVPGYPEFSCAFGGGCLFNSNDLFPGFYADKPIELSWCGSRVNNEIENSEEEVLEEEDFNGEDKPYVCPDGSLATICGSPHSPCITTYCCDKQVIGDKYSNFVYCRASPGAPGLTKVYRFCYNSCKVISWSDPVSGVDPNDCEPCLNYSNNCVPPLDDPNPIYSITGSCDDNIFNIIYNKDLREYFLQYIPNGQDSTHIIKRISFNSLDYLADIHLQSSIENHEIPLHNILNDSENNIYILYGGNQLKLFKLNTIGNALWSISLPNLSYKSLTKNASGSLNLICFDRTTQEYVLLSISENGVLESTEPLPLNHIPYSKINQSGHTTVALESISNKMVFATTGSSIEKSVPQGVIIKDITTLENGNILAAGEFNGHISVGDVSYNSEEFDNAIFITYDKVGNILASQSVQNYRDETVQGIATKGNEEVAYHGRYKEIVLYAPDPADNVVESCIFVNIISLVDTSCTLLPPVLSLDETACKLSLSSTEPEVIYTLHEEVDGVWQEVNGAVFPYQPEANGRYRASAKKEGCTTAFSDITEVNCLKIPLPCDITLLGLTYDTLADKFAWYWGETKFGLDSIFGNTIDKTLITSTITTFVKYQISYTWVKYIRYDSQGTVYIFGTDGTTKSFVTTVTTSGVITTTWYQDVILHDIIWRPVLYQYSLLMFDKILNQYTHQIRRLSGQLISTENLGDFQSGKYTFELLQYHKTGYYTNIEYSSAQTRIRWYMGPTTYVTNLPPAVRVKRIQKWSQDRWMVSTEYTGTIIINGTTYTSIGYNTVMFIWYDNQGNVIKVTEIKHSRDEFISHVSTDGFKKVAYTGIYRDTIYNSNYPNGYIIEECAFMDGLDVEFNTPAPIVVPTLSKTDRVPKSSQEFRFYPNPFSKGINLDITSDIAEEVNIETYNIVGALMFTTKLDLQQGQNVRYMDAFERIPAGVYMVKIKSTTREHMTRVIRIE